MTLAEAEQDERFDAFKIMSMLDLVQYINRCEIYLSKNDDVDVTAYRDAAKLIRDALILRRLKDR